MIDLHSFLLVTAFVGSILLITLAILSYWEYK